MKFKTAPFFEASNTERAFVAKHCTYINPQVSKEAFYAPPKIQIRNNFIPILNKILKVTQDYST